MSETQIDRNDEWGKTLELMCGLFPKWRISEEQHDTWKMQFGMMNPMWLREALQLVYSRYSSEIPKPKWVNEALKEVKAGRTGMPMDESSRAERTRVEKEEEQEAYDREAKRDRANASRHVNQWTDEEKYKWGKAFKDRFGFLTDDNDLKDSTTWSETFTQFVYVFRGMNNGVV